MKRKILVPMFASVVALSMSSVANADETNNETVENKETTSSDIVDLGEYNEVTYKKAVVKEGVGVKIREEGSVQTVAYSGDILKVVATQGEWVKVELGESEGWLASRYVDLVESTGYTSHDRVNFRKEANTEAEIIEELSIGSSFKVLEDQGEWLKVKKGETEGYVSSKYVSDKAPVIEKVEEEVQVASNTTQSNSQTNNQTNNNVSSNGSSNNSNSGSSNGSSNNSNSGSSNGSSNNSNSGSNSGSSNNQKPSDNQGGSYNPPSANTSLAQAVVNLAYSKIGSPYVWGAEGPNSFDCSGLTSYVYRNAAGISLPRTSSAQSGYGTTVSKSNLQPGDLVFFTTNGTGGVSHVGIYVGGGNMVHSPAPGQTVHVASINNSYYGPRFVTAKRVL